MTEGKALKHFDIVIVGGGMVGASLAAVLPASLSIALLESFPLPDAAVKSDELQPSFDNRATALSKSSQHFFEQAGIWHTIAPLAERISDVHVSDQGQWGSVLLSESEEALDELGFVIENASLGRLIFSAIVEKANIEFISPATVKQLKPLSDGVSVSYDCKSEAQQLEAKLAIIADGAKSGICKQLGIQTHIQDYHHSAIVTNVATANAHQGIAYERFTATGPMALLPLLPSKEGEHRSALIWTLATDEAKALMAANDEDFLQTLQQRFGAWQGEFVQLGKRFSYPLQLSSSKEQVRNHIVVMGNAAHSLHPVAGQGFNLALRDVTALKQTIEKAIAEHRPWHKLEVLEAYYQQQQLDQALTISFSDALPQLFSNTNNTLQRGRNLGLLALDILPSLKTRFVHFATGYR